MFLGRHKAETLWTSNKQASNEQLNTEAARNEVHVAVAQSHRNVLKCGQKWWSRKSSRAKGIESKVTSKSKNISRVCDPTCQKSNKKSKSNRLHAEKKFENLRHGLSRPLVPGSHCQNLCTTSRIGASENWSAIQQLRHEREHLVVHSRNLETETHRCQSAVNSGSARCANSSVERNDSSRKTKHQILNRQIFFLWET